MHSPRSLLLIFVLPAALLATGTAQAQPKAVGKIVCWKDKSGKVVGCGDTVPPEFQDSAIKEMNQRGITVKQSDAALTPEQKKAQQVELERKQADGLKQAELRRRDKALLDTFTTDKEIDLKRNRDVQLVESNIETLQTNLKNANDRQAEVRARVDSFKKRNAPVPAAAQEEFDRTEGEKVKIQNQITQKRKEIAEMNITYDEMKKRFIELKGGATAAATPATGTAPGKK